MDLLDFIPTEDATVVELTNPFTNELFVKDDGNVMTITVYMPHSAQYRAAVHDQTNKRIARAQKGNRSTYTSEEMEAATLDLLVATTKDWDIQMGGEEPKFTPEACRNLYDKLPWIRKQILDAQENFESFLKK